jgi:formate dehydrogenase major subunit
VDWYYDHPRDVFNEMRTCMDSIAGITWERLERDSSVTYPCVQVGDPGDPVVFCDTFPTTSGRAKFVPADLISAAERPDAEYPMVLITGRQLEHWHTGSMTRRSAVLDQIEPEAVAFMSPKDMRRMKVWPGDLIRLETRRGAVEVKVRSDRDVPENMVFMPFCYAEAAANLLTNPALDPFGKIPEFKFCAVRAERAEIQAAAE